MARYSVTIDTGNAAFEENEPQEVARILRNLARTLETEMLLRNVSLWDINGNRVGTAGWEE